MEAITVYPKNKEDLTFLKQFLTRTKMPFIKENEVVDDFELTDEMKRVIDERLLQDRSKAVNAKDFLKELRGKYGI